MDQGVVGVMCAEAEGLGVLNMPVWLRIGTALESCKPCQGELPRRSLWRAAAIGKL